MSRERPALLFPALGLTVLLASGTFIVAREALREFDPLVLAMLRFVFAVALLWPLTRLIRPGVRIERRDRGRILVLGLLAVPLNQTLFLVAMQWAAASHAALLYALTPTFAVLLGPLFGEQRPGRREVLGIAMAFSGVVLLLTQKGLHFDPNSITGDVLILLAVAAWACYLVLGREVTHRYGPLVVTSEALLWGTLMFAPIGIYALLGFDASKVSFAGWSGLFYLAWLTSGVSYVLWFWGLKYLASGTIALLTNLQPVVTAVLAWLFLREPLPAGFALSLVLVLGGVWITQRASILRRRAAAP